MRQTSRGAPRGRKWTLTDPLEDLNFADDSALLAHRHQDLESKTQELATNGFKIGLQINTDKTKVMRINERSTVPITLNNNKYNIEVVSEFVYLGAKITSDGNSDEDINNRKSKARRAFAA